MKRGGTHQDWPRQLELTPRQRQVIDLLARDYTNVQIGEALGISLDGAKWHVGEIIGKLDVSSREEAVAFWRAYNRPGARLSRMVHSLAAAGGAHWAAGTAAASVVIGGAAIVAIALTSSGNGSNSTEAAGSTPTATEPADDASPPPAASSTSTPNPPATAPTTPGATAATGSGSEQRTEFVVYLFEGETLTPAWREVAQTESVGRAALENLFASPTGDDENIGLGSAIPEDTGLLGLSIDGGVATVNLSPEFESGGGSLSMQSRLTQVVYTLTQFPTVDQVLFEIEGEAVEALGGEGIVLDGPVGRDDFEAITPAILVESPANWETVTSPLRITGTANTFEATFQVNIVDNDGLIVAESVVTATSGSGTRGTFDITLPFDVTREGLGSIIVFENSAQDGSQVNVAETRVYFEE